MGLCKGNFESLLGGKSHTGLTGKEAFPRRCSRKELD